MDRLRPLKPMDADSGLRASEPTDRRRRLGTPQVESTSVSKVGGLRARSLGRDLRTWTC